MSLVRGTRYRPSFTVVNRVELPKTYRHKPELGRLTTRGRSTDDGSRTTLLVVHEVDGSWTTHGLGAPGVTLPAADMAALAESILARAR